MGDRVRDFEVIDAFPFGIQFSWEKDGEPTTTVLFERNGPIPSAKMLTFFRCGACRCWVGEPVHAYKVGAGGRDSRFRFPQSDTDIKCVARARLLRL